MDKTRTTNGEKPREIDDIRDYSVIRWRTLKSVASDNIRRVLHDSSHSEVFSDSYIASVGNRWRELERLHIKLGVFLFALVLFVGTLQMGAIETITIFGLRFTNDNESVAILLLVATMLLLAMSMVSMMDDHYAAVIASYSIEKAGEDMADLYKLQFSWHGTNILDGLWKRDGKQFANIAVPFLVLLLLTMVVLFGLFVEILQLYLLVGTIIFVIENPTLPSPIHVAITALSFTAIAIYGICWTLKLPLPYTDYTNLSRLKRLETDDPEAAAQARRNIAQHSLRKERRNILVLQQLSMISVMIAFYLLRYRHDFFSDIEFLWPIAIASLVMSIAISPLLDQIERSVILTSDDASSEKLQVERYVRNKKRLFRMRMIVSVVSGILFFLWFAVF